jgi:hypothetical protein
MDREVPLRVHCIYHMDRNSKYPEFPLHQFNLLFGQFHNIIFAYIETEGEREKEEKNKNKRKMKKLNYKTFSFPPSWVEGKED